VSAYDLRIGERFWYQGSHWIVLEANPGGEPGAWLIRPLEGGPERVIYKRDRVWPREPSRFERLRPPSAPAKGKHAHQWREIAGGRGRLCSVCGRGQIRTPRGWRNAT